ncbi:threonine dehydrogenase-like Zn-dependent dehydrogenase [Streptomyces sp. SAI-135]|jgi:threonine dehydrogenase-like Zn-dependent dehydrogenase|uniref:alcohol dehydrogenase catalytic domain-containing protein n=1 Tax=unclassified Streptomyces TaxID=2593676 RepID=UPI0024742513|nr:MULTISPECIES: zinc-binding dehydrogenase [unclassified Streptomyces]MDH6521926.1 threonine dehydrogenase-like Zn-dependent dehydrogenase [Streptomyces sp. SAI-090]MDH6573295.1 threonine dehydrogenase-like Zn-dependent dehydrogenase [Streptomyces sp. SAI-117]MDH6613972.1 threonine dehydrogenase-like Zn-dependent dehydrogenase [Streptomyces sp. SAI-135]
MRAAVMQSGKIFTTDLPDPVPGPGQLLVAPIAVGVCGSDLSAWQHTDDFLAAHQETGALGEVFDPDRPLVLGHEFTARVVEVGEGAEGYAVGDELVVLPGVTAPDGRVHTVGYANDYPGGLAERSVVWAYGHLRIPAGVDPVLAAVTEPLATGVNGVLRAGVHPADGALVTGVGPVGLGTVIELAARGVAPIVVSDPSAARRRIALAYGAHLAVDPLRDDPVEAWRAAAQGARRLHVIEASGARGLLASLMASAPAHSRISVIGAGMRPEEIRPVVGVLKNTAIEFVGGPGIGESGYRAFGRAFEHLREGRFDPALMVTGYTGLEGAAEVFNALRPGSPEAIEHVKILVRHDLPGNAILGPDELA